MEASGCCSQAQTLLMHDAVTAVARAIDDLTTHDANVFDPNTRAVCSLHDKPNTRHGTAMRIYNALEHLVRWLCIAVMFCPPHTDQPIDAGYYIQM